MSTTPRNPARNGFATFCPDAQVGTALTVRLNVVVCVADVPVPVIVIGYVPAGVEDDVEIDTVDELPDVTEVGENEAVAPAGRPLALSETVCAEPEVIAALWSFRPNTGTAPQEFVQRASVVAWNDEAHVEKARERYARKRQVLEPLLDVAPGSSEATFYLWFRVPEGESSESFATRLLGHGVVVAPGS